MTTGDYGRPARRRLESGGFVGWISALGIAYAGCSAEAIQGDPPPPDPSAGEGSTEGGSGGTAGSGGTGVSGGGTSSGGSGNAGQGGASATGGTSSGGSGGAMGGSATGGKGGTSSGGSSGATGASAGVGGSSTGGTAGKGGSAGTATGGSGGSGSGCGSACPSGLMCLCCSGTSNCLCTIECSSDDSCVGASMLDPSYDHCNPRTGGQDMCGPADLCN